MYLLGIDAMKYLNSNDPLEIRIMAEILKEAVELQNARDHRLAVEIRNQIGQLLDG